MGEDITWPDQVAPRGRKASSTRKIKPQTSNLKPQILNTTHTRTTYNLQSPRPHALQLNRITGACGSMVARVPGICL